MKAESFDCTVFIGRFQPFHNAHLYIVKEALAISKKVIIIVGSYRTTPTVKNPWTFEERKQMIKDSIRKEFNNYHDDLTQRVEVIPIRDYMYSMETWLSAVQNAIAQRTDCDDKVRIIGHFKDDSSFYLKCFPQWAPIIQMDNYQGINGEDLRNIMFNPNDSNSKIKPKVSSVIYNWIKNFVKTEKFKELQRNYKFINDYKRKWAKSPYVPTFVTTDAVVTQAGHVLVIKRGINPCKGQYALAGGFVNPDETIKQACYRELKEETNIKLAKPISVNAEMLKKEIMNSIIDYKIFDHPKRDPRGRFVTHAFHFQLNDKDPLPIVKGGDDAEQAIWMSFADVRMNEDKFFADHIHIISHFVSGV